MADLQDQMMFNDMISGDFDVDKVYELDEGYSVVPSGSSNVSAGLDTAMKFIAINENVNYTGKEPYLLSYNDDPSGQFGSRFNTVGPGLRFLYAHDDKGKEVVIPVQPNTYYDQKLVTNSFGRFVADRYQKNSQLIPNWESLNNNQKAAITSLIYNVGYQAFSKKAVMNENGGKDSVHTNAYKALENFDLKTFAKEAFDPQIGFVRSDGEIIKGLQNRRHEELELFNTPDPAGFPPDELLENEEQNYASLNNEY